MGENDNADAMRRMTVSEGTREPLANEEMEFNEEEETILLQEEENRNRQENATMLASGSGITRHGLQENSQHAREDARTRPSSSSNRNKIIRDNNEKDEEENTEPRRRRGYRAGRQHRERLLARANSYRARVTRQTYQILHVMQQIYRMAAQPNYHYPRGNRWSRGNRWNRGSRGYNYRGRGRGNSY